MTMMSVRLGKSGLAGRTAGWAGREACALAAGRQRGCEPLWKRFTVNPQTLHKSKE
jgi:hypothetical protein